MAWRGHSPLARYACCTPASGNILARGPLANQRRTGWRSARPPAWACRRSSPGDGTGWRQRGCRSCPGSVQLPQEGLPDQGLGESRRYGIGDDRGQPQLERGHDVAQPLGVAQSHRAVTVVERSLEPSFLGQGLVRRPYHRDADLQPAGHDAHRRQPVSRTPPTGQEPNPQDPHHANPHPFAGGSRRPAFSRCGCCRTASRRRCWCHGALHPRCRYVGCARPWRFFPVAGHAHADLPPRRFIPSTSLHGWLRSTAAGSRRIRAIPDFVVAAHAQVPLTKCALNAQSCPPEPVPPRLWPRHVSRRHSYRHCNDPCRYPRLRQPASSVPRMPGLHSGGFAGSPERQDALPRCDRHGQTHVLGACDRPPPSGTTACPESRTRPSACSQSPPTRRSGRRATQGL